jgi:Lipocalin-like domain
MKRRLTFGAVSALFVLLAGLSLSATHAVAQAEKQLIGSWDTPKSDSYGENARGLLLFTADGRYQLSIQRATLPHFASNNRTKGTSQEEHAVVEGSINHYGRYTVDENKKAITFHIDGSTFPNWIGTTQERPYTITGDALVYKVRIVSGTGQPGETTWKRVKN